MIITTIINSTINAKLLIITLPDSTGNRTKSYQEIQTKILEIPVTKATAIGHSDLQVETFCETIAMPPIETIQIMFSPIE